MDDGILYAKTENMYIDYSTGGSWLESFPGYRHLTNFNGKINGIYDMGFGDEGFLVHAGTSLYKCRFQDKNLDSAHYTKLCDANDNKSFCYSLGNSAVFFDGADIAVISEDLNAKKMSNFSSAVYVPTTYVNGAEEEQLNLLTDKFREEWININSSDLAYESPGLLFKIKSEASRTCSVVGAEEGVSGTLEIPNRKRINGRYYQVVEIADQAFENLEDITGVILGSKIARVGKKAFSGCTNLELAVMPDGIEEIDELAFGGCASLENVYIGVSCRSIYYDAFSDCPSSMNVHFSDTYEHLEKCDGVGNLMIFTVTYSSRYKLQRLGIPLFTPTRAIISVMLDGEEIAYNSDTERGIVIILADDISDLEGKSISILGKLDSSKARISERGTTFSALVGADADPKATIVSCIGGESYDGRAFIFGSPNYKNLIFVSSFTREGKIHPLYFGDLDYFTVGGALHAISDVRREGGRLAVAKPSEGGGSIFLLYPKGESGATFGRHYPVIYTLKDTGIRSKLYEFNSSTIFVGKSDIYKMKYSSSSATFEPISLRCPDDMRKSISGDMIFTTIGGYLAAIIGTDMYLGDPRLTFEAVGCEQYKWFPIKDIGVYEGDKRDYYYAKSDVTGIYTHQDVGKVASGTVYSYVDEEGKTIYYVTIGIRKYRVVPGEEVLGGVILGISNADKYNDTIIFGAENGSIYAFNTDKKGIAPKHLYTSNSFNWTSYSQYYKNKIHPYFYTNAGHRIKYSLTTAPYNGGLGHVLKSNVPGSLTARLSARAAAKISFSTSTDRKEATRLGGIVIGRIDFLDVGFDKISFGDDSPEIISIPEGREKWAEKQITVYTDELKSPFAINLISLGFKVDGLIKNGQQA